MKMMIIDNDYDDDYNDDDDDDNDDYDDLIIPHYNNFDRGRDMAHEKGKTLIIIVSVIRKALKLK